MIKALLLAVSLVLSTAPVAQAAIFQFSYVFDRVGALSGWMSGTASGDVVNIRYAWLSRVGERRTPYPSFAYTLAGDVRGQVSFSGDVMDIQGCFFVCDNGFPPFFSFGERATLNHYSFIADEEFSADRWSLRPIRPGTANAVVPLPAGALLLGTALIGCGVVLRRRG